MEFIQFIEFIETGDTLEFMEFTEIGGWRLPAVCRRLTGSE